VASSVAATSQRKGGGLFASLGSALGSIVRTTRQSHRRPGSPGKAYRVGENGPELFVPTSSGRIESGGGRAGAATVNLTIRVSDNGRMSAPDALQRSSRQVARAIRASLAQAED
jgi:hypothetical protein